MPPPPLDELELVSPVGFADLVPRHGRKAGATEVLLLHRFTQEKIVLGCDFLQEHGIAPHARGKFCLLMEDGRLHLAYEEAVFAQVADIFRTRLMEKAGKWLRVEAGTAVAVSRSQWQWTVKYLFIDMLGGKHCWKVWQVSSYTIGGPALALVGGHLVFPSHVRQRVRVAGHG